MKIAKRIIFNLLFSNGNFYLSRNFNLQKVGDLEWIKKNFQFHKLIFSVDELMILNVDRNNKNILSLAKILEQISKNCFIPITAGGGIKNIDDAKLLFRSGADKIVFNTSIKKNPKLIKKISEVYGEQSIVASVDVKENQSTQLEVYFQNGRINSKIKLEKYFEFLQKQSIGEILINSIDRDGTGFGVDEKILKNIKKISKPLIISGGLGKKEHFLKCLSNNKIDAVGTANLLNFLGTALHDVRNFLYKKKLNIAKWK
jgi:imidazole glycerol-phosphate synthase subunit HisF